MGEHWRRGLRLPQVRAEFQGSFRSSDTRWRYYIQEAAVVSVSHLIIWPVRVILASVGVVSSSGCFVVLHEWHKRRLKLSPVVVQLSSDMFIEHIALTILSIACSAVAKKKLVGHWVA